MVSQLYLCEFEKNYFLKHNEFAAWIAAPFALCIDAQHSCDEAFTNSTYEAISEFFRLCALVITITKVSFPLLYLFFSFDLVPLTRKPVLNHYFKIFYDATSKLWFYFY